MGGDYLFKTKGDANNATDPTTVRPEQIRGKRWYSVPYLAWPTLKVGANIRQVVVLGAVLVLLGYAVASFAGAALDRRRSRKATPGADLQVEERDNAGAAS
jgi:signal peptidase